MLPGFLTPRKFLYKFSLHVGVVTICSMGLMLYTISFFINMFGRDAEFKDQVIVVHWFVVIIFILTGFSIYVVGFVAAYKESSFTALLATYFLIIHCVCWLGLTGLSFVNNVTLNGKAWRAFLGCLILLFKQVKIRKGSKNVWPTQSIGFICIDNRCADRLYIKNGNWRRADEHCKNPSDLRGMLLGDIDIEEEEGGTTEGSGDSGSGSTRKESDKDAAYGDARDTDNEQEEERGFVEYIYDHGLGVRTPSNIEKHGNRHARGMLRNASHEVNEIVPRKKRRDSEEDDSSLRERNRSRITSESPARKLQLHILKFATLQNKTDDMANDTSANNFVNTPIGKVGCNAPHHIAFSVICALMIFCIWYIYPILVFRSYSKRLRRRSSLQKGKSPEK